MSLLTLDQIHLRVAKVFPCSRRKVDRCIKKLGIKPAGEIRSCPLLYPPDATVKVLDGLGFMSRIVTLPQLRSARSKAQKARGK